MCFWSGCGNRCQVVLWSGCMYYENWVAKHPRALNSFWPYAASKWIVWLVLWGGWHLGAKAVQPCMLLELLAWGSACPGSQGWAEASSWWEGRCIWDSSYLGREEGAGKVPKRGILTVGTFVLSQRFHVWSPTFLAVLRKIKVWGKCFTGRTWVVNWGSELCMHVGLGKAGFTGLLLQSCCETNAFFLAHPTLSYKSVIL